MPAGKGRGECVIYHLAKSAAFTQRSERLIFNAPFRSAGGRQNGARGVCERNPTIPGQNVASDQRDRMLKTVAHDAWWRTVQYIT